MIIPPPQETAPRVMALSPINGTPIVKDTEKWMTGKAFVMLGLISLFLMIGPFLIWRFWAVINNWGWWRPAAPKSPRHQRHYTKTWHGWVAVEEYEEGLERKRQACKKLHATLGLKTSRADYSWVFWDPAGWGKKAFDERKQPWESWLPAWTRSWDFGSIAWRKGDGMLQAETEDLEKGLRQTGTTNRQPEAQSEARSGTVQFKLPRKDGFEPQATIGGWMTGASTTENDWENSGTIRRRVVSRVTPVWTTDGMEVQSVPAKQPVLPHIVDEHMASTTTEPEKPPKINWPRLTSSMHESFSHTIQRAHSVPIMSPIKSGYNLRPTPLPSYTVQPEESKVLYRARSIEGPAAPNVSEDIPTPRGFTPEAGDLGVRSRKTFAAMSDMEFVEDLQRSLQVWAEPRILNPFASVGGENCGTAGRSPSPAMGWKIVGDEPDNHVEDMRHYEDGSDAGLTVSDASSSVDDWLPYPKYDQKSCHVPAAYINDDRVKTSSSRRSSEKGPQRTVDGYHGQLATYNADSGDKWYNKYKYGPSFRPEDQVARHKSGSRPDRAVDVSPLRSPRAVSRTRSVTFNLPTGKAHFPQLPGARRSLAMPVAHRSLSLPETLFVHDLDHKLTWLGFQLAPGFRGPEDNPAETWSSHTMNSLKFSANVVSRATEMQKRSWTRSGARRTDGPITGVLQVRRGLETPNINDWRRAINTLRWSSGNGDVLQGLLQYQGGSVEPREQEIDTSAWILRRPPQGWPPTEMGISAYYSGIKGYAEKMWEWEAVRRPYVLERLVKKHEAHEHDGAGGVALKSIRKMLGFEKEDPKGKKGKEVDVSGRRLIELDEGANDANSVDARENRLIKSKGKQRATHRAVAAESTCDEWFDVEAYERESPLDHAVRDSEAPLIKSNQGQKSTYRAITAEKTTSDQLFDAEAYERESPLDDAIRETEASLAEFHEGQRRTRAAVGGQSTSNRLFDAEAYERESPLDDTVRDTEASSIALNEERRPTRAAVADESTSGEWVYIMAHGRENPPNNAVRHSAGSRRASQRSSTLDTIVEEDLSRDWFDAEDYERESLLDDAISDSEV